MRNKVARVPAVSVIMAAHDSAPFIIDTIQSVRGQDFTDWELLVVDDCSSDDTLAIVRRIAVDDDRLRVFALDRNQGPAAARNTAIENARGRYIAFLDSDDLWKPNKLSVQIEYMRRSGHPFTYTGYERMTEGGELLGTVRVPTATTYRRLLKRNVVACLTAVYDRAYFGTILMPSIRKGQDYGLWLLLVNQATTAHGIDQVLGRYRVRTRSVSSNKFESSSWVWKIYRHVAGLNFFSALYYFSHYAATGAAFRILERWKA
jgi:teichuronic acid biosynthesis glycosyltransferase TuaG